VVVALASLAVTACGATASERTDLPLTPLQASCPTSAGPPSTEYARLPLLPADVEPVGVIECQNNRVGDPGSGWVERRATAGIEAYVTALRLPDERAPLFGGVSCTADALLIPWSAVLLADGTALRVGTPLSVCGKPRQEAATAYEALGWSETARVPAPAG
jgi:hypothetical protein